MERLLKSVSGNSRAKAKTFCACAAEGGKAGAAAVMSAKTANPDALAKIAMPLSGTFVRTPTVPLDLTNVCDRS